MLVRSAQPQLQQCLWQWVTITVEGTLRHPSRHQLLRLIEAQVFQLPTTWSNFELPSNSTSLKNKTSAGEDNISSTSTTLATTSHQLRQRSIMPSFPSPTPSSNNLSSHQEVRHQPSAAQVHTRTTDAPIQQRWQQNSQHRQRNTMLSQA